MHATLLTELDKGCFHLILTLKSMDCSLLLEKRYSGQLMRHFAPAWLWKKIVER